MKTLQDIQYNIKEREKMHIIMDYEGVISILNSSYSTDLINPMYKRIFENFARKEKIQFTVLIDKKDKKFKPKSIYKNTNILYEDTEEFKEGIENLIDAEFEPVYFGSNKDIVMFFKKNKLFSVGIEPDEKSKKKYTLWLSKDTFIKFLTETNNVYL
jgi:hypothetical protein